MKRLVGAEKTYDYKTLEAKEKHQREMQKKCWYIRVEYQHKKPLDDGTQYTVTFYNDSVLSGSKWQS